MQITIYSTIHLYVVTYFVLGEVCAIYIEGSEAKKDEFMNLDQCGMILVDYKAKFHVKTRYST